MAAGEEFGVADLLEILAEMKDEVVELKEERDRSLADDITEIQKALQTDMDPGEKWQPCDPGEQGFYASSTFKKVQ